ncbi:hypothetical protein NTE_02536 [Candidatus Nitrososphaera evergladensis SR1]|uniref:HEPN domain-containing protein n=1 Tax=Candidatus Nitrososphaera evergladensis SR1 TaxID=1459636 RepID=A0A075MTW3_9ARCH|nr:HEPN domain-containing protein [Candidatus Nitrososphaera evergladensis]AIF84583.1 hypothetical protein NTE_02536 [Candidatus Nitrososphaera evergladensis SR1]
MQNSDLTLTKALFKTALSDYNAAKLLWEKGFYPQCIFYLEQAFEKASKSIIAHFSVNLKKCPQEKIEKELKKSFGHNNKYSAYTVVMELLEADKWKKQQSGKWNEKQANVAFAFAEGHKKTKQNYKIEQYCNMVDYYYSKYNQFMAHPKLRHPANAILALNWALSSCFEDMENRARYPLSEHGYLNLDKLNQEKNKDCYKLLLIMVRDYINRTPDLINVANEQLPPYYNRQR